MIHDFHVAFGHPSFPFAWVVKGVKDWSIIGNEVNAENLSNEAIANLRLKLLNEEFRKALTQHEYFTVMKVLPVKPSLRLSMPLAMFLSLHLAQVVFTT